MFSDNGVDRKVMSLRNFSYFVGLGLMVGLLQWGWGYYSLLNRGSYEFGVNFIKGNKVVNETLGKVESCRLGYVNFGEHFSAGVWLSTFNVVVGGEKKSGTVVLQLESSPSGWKVNSAFLESTDGLVGLLNSGSTAR